jgi:hypothetical protein
MNHWIRLAFSLVAGLVVLTLATPAHAHKPSDAYMRLSVEGDSPRATGRLDLAIRDLDYALGVDENHDGDVTWGELRAKQDLIKGYVNDRVKISADGNTCILHQNALSTVHHSDGAYAVLDLVAECAGPIHALDLHYALFFDVDPQHRGLLRVGTGAASQPLTFSDTEQDLHVVPHELSAWRPFTAMVRQGVSHIAQGYDHLLFLIALLLTAVLVQKTDGSSTPVASFRTALWDVARIVTAFTVAHSITLSLASTRLVSLPSRVVESAIAISVVVAAANNLRRFLGKDRWIAAFALGLLHGFGFSSTLLDLGLPKDGLIVSLLGFNVGVELGQLAVVALFLPVAFALRGTILYRHWLLKGGSVAIALVAGVWLVERAFAVTLFGRLLPG